MTDTNRDTPTDNTPTRDTPTRTPRTGEEMGEEATRARVVAEFDAASMRSAIVVAATARFWTAPNPWVGAVLVSPEGRVIGSGATEPPGGRHAEIVAIAQAGAGAVGATLYTTLEPCAHHGRTPPCTEAIIDAGVRRVVIGVLDPDPQVGGRGVASLRAAGIEVVFDVESAAITDQLRSYLHHRRTGRPFVYCKVAASLDGGTAAADGSSQWITGEASRRDGHRLRAESGAIIVGAGTVRTDDPSLTVRHVEGPDPQRIVLGTAPPGARVHPCSQWRGPLADLLDELGGRGVLQVLVEGGATVVRSFLDEELVDRFVVYVAPALFAGADAHPFVGGATAGSIEDLWRGRFVSVDRLGDDLRIELAPDPRPSIDAVSTSIRPPRPVDHQHEPQE